MELEEFIDFVNIAKKKEEEERQYQQWCAMLPSFKEYKSFEWLKDTISGNSVDMRPEEEIIEDIKEIHRKAGMTDGFGNI